VCELVAGHGRRLDWAVCTAIALVLGLATLAVYSTFAVDRPGEPSDEELTSNFLSHEAGFDELVRRLGTDRQARLATNAARVRMYKGLLQRLSVQDLRYFPGSGKLVLVPDGQPDPERPSTTYLYLPHAQPQPLAQYHGYAWHGPGVYILTGDRPLKGSWFVHHDMTIEVAVTPY
jgi:hypothetical protein